MRGPYINKYIFKAIMNQTRLRNSFLKSRSFEDKAAYEGLLSVTCPEN